MPDTETEHYDVGLVGVGVGANYGSVLTYYSLYKTLEGFGNRVLMVSKIGARADDHEIRNTHSMRFAQRHYNLSRVYGLDELDALNARADTFVLGSDQVWNYAIAKAFGRAFYLSFAGDDKRTLSYAASFGHAHDFAPGNEIKELSGLMRRFNAISVREDSGVSIARRKYGVRATQVAEPIFLTDAAAYRELAAESDRDVSGPYLLAYILDPTPEKKAAIEHLARKQGLRIRVVLDAWAHLAAENKKKLDMGDVVEDDIDTYDFLRLYDNASYVVTDSFHGTAFALKFEKPFASIGNAERGATRFESMFRLIGHDERLTMDAGEVLTRDGDFLAPLDFTSIRAALADHVRDSKEWLEAALRAPLDAAVDGASPSLLDRPLVRRAEHAVRTTGRKMRLMMSRPRVRLDAPPFSANSEAWAVEPGEGATRLRVTSPAHAKRKGNFVWTDLPLALPDGAAYELGLDWAVRSTAREINVHLRNPETGSVVIVGTLDVGDDTDVARHDVIRFYVEGAGLSQVMFGAKNFAGDDGGADVSRITLRPVLPETVA